MRAMAGPTEDVKAEGNEDKLTLKNPADISNFSEQFKGYRLVRDGDGNVWVQAMMLVDPGSNPVSTRPSVALEDAASQLPVDVTVFTATTFNTGIYHALEVAAGMFVAKPDAAGLELLRTPGTFKLGTASAINTTALWTPTAGKRFRIMGYTVTLPNTATSAAGTTITLMDGAANVFYLCVIGTTTGGLAYSVVLPGNGYLSTTINNVLNINLTAALTVGVISVNVYGAEE